jgi:hypothetical protein
VGAAVMPTYRLYTITPDEHIQAPPAVVECEDDQAAIERAKQLLDGRAIEVWQLDRRVTRLEPKG